MTDESNHISEIADMRPLQLWVKGDHESGSAEQSISEFAKASGISNTQMKRHQDLVLSDEMSLAKPEHAYRSFVAMLNASSFLANICLKDRVAHLLKQHFRVLPEPTGLVKGLLDGLVKMSIPRIKVATLSRDSNINARIAEMMKCARELATANNDPEVVLTKSNEIFFDHATKLREAGIDIWATISQEFGQREEDATIISYLELGLEIRHEEDEDTNIILSMDERNEAAKKLISQWEPYLLKADLMLLTQMMQFEPYAPYQNLNNFWLNLGFEIPKLVARKAITKPKKSTGGSQTYITTKPEQSTGGPQTYTADETASGTEEN